MYEPIHYGSWWIYPSEGYAINLHNGNRAYINNKEVYGVNLPAKWMLEELAEWARIYFWKQEHIFGNKS
jgi:hypothetical protein